MASLIIGLIAEAIEAALGTAASIGIDTAAEAGGGALLTSGLPSEIAETLAGPMARKVAKTAAGIGIGTGVGFIGDKIAGALESNDNNVSHQRDVRQLQQRVNKMKLNQQKLIIKNFLNNMNNRYKGLNVQHLPIIPYNQANSLFTNGPIDHIPVDPNLILPKRIAEIRDIDIIENSNPNSSFGQTVWRQYIS